MTRPAYGRRCCNTIVAVDLGDHALSWYGEKDGRDRSHCSRLVGVGVVAVEKEH